MPDHGHQGLELTLVLQGAFRDEEDRFARGDVEIATEDTQHTPIAEPGQDCICLAATDAPLKFRALIPRWRNHFCGFDAGQGRGAAARPRDLGNLNTRTAP